jgi:hypothetical protein
LQNASYYKESSSMAATVLPRLAESQPTGLSGIRVSVTLVQTAWFLLVVSLGAVEAFAARPGTPPLLVAQGGTIAHDHKDSHPLPHHTAAESWDQENLKRADHGCPAAIYYVNPQTKLLELCK